MAAGAAVVLLRTARKQQQSHHIGSEASGPGKYPKLILLESANIRYVELLIFAYISWFFFKNVCFEKSSNKYIEKWRRALYSTCLESMALLPNSNQVGIYLLPGSWVSGIPNPVTNHIKRHHQQPKPNRSRSSLACCVFLHFPWSLESWVTPWYWNECDSRSSGTAAASAKKLQF